MFSSRLTLAADLGVLLVALAIAVPAGAAPLACGDVITKDTTLHADLEDCPGDGLVIGADGITLDLNGHAIEGTGLGSGPDIVYGDTRDGVDNTAEHSGVTIENGVIGHFEVGVKLYEADANHITGLELRQTNAGLLPVESGGNLIDFNDSHDNGYGFYIYESDGNVVRDNVLTANAFGMYPVESSDNRIERNSIQLSQFLGLQVTQGSNGNLIRENVVHYSHSLGLLLSDSDDNVVEDNRLTDHAVAGMIFAQTKRTLARRNRVSSSGPNLSAPPPLAGIWLSSWNDDFALKRNSVSGYPAGIRLQGAFTGLVVARNQVFRNSGDGIFGEEGVTGLIDRNFAYRNGDDGIDVRDAGTKVSRNLAYSNGDYGIEAVPGADGGGNRAWDNGNPAQCLNVLCSG